MGRVACRHGALAHEFDDELDLMQRSGLEGQVQAERLKRDLRIGSKRLTKKIRETGTQSLYSNSCRILGLIRQSSLTFTCN